MQLVAVHRREKILNAILDTDVLIDDIVFDKIHGPAGLAIGSKTPEEIALSIMAEITSTWHTNPKQAEYACFSSGKGIKDL